MPAPGFLPGPVVGGGGHHSPVLSRDLLAEAGIEVSSVLLISKPYEERRAYATARKLWPDVEIVSASSPMTLRDHADSIGDARLVIDMFVGALQRLLVYPEQGFMIGQTVPADVIASYERLRQGGFTSRLLQDDEGQALRGAHEECPVDLSSAGVRGPHAPPRRGWEQSYRHGGEVGSGREVPAVQVQASLGTTASQS